MTDATYNVFVPEKGVPVKAWTKGVQLEEQAKQQLLNAAQMPFVFKWVAAMPVCIGESAQLSEALSRRRVRSSRRRWALTSDAE